MATDHRKIGSTDVAERRQFGRFATRVPVCTHRDDLPRHGQGKRPAQCQLQLRDFSLGGLRAESPIPLKIKERLTLRLPPTAQHQAVHVTGQVIHCRRHEDRYQVGIKFHDGGSRASPYRRLPRLFSVAADFAGEVREVSSSR